MTDFRSFRIAAAVPQLKPGNISFNTEEIIACARKACDHGAAVTVFPELSLTGRGCGDLFNSAEFRREVAKGIKALKKATETLEGVLIAGFPLYHRGRIYDCSGVFCKGELTGIVCKCAVKNDLFTSGLALSDTEIFIDGADVPVSENLVFECDGVCFGIVIGEDLLLCGNPSAQIAAGGARMIFHPGAFPELTFVSREQQLYLQQLSRQLTAVIVSAGAGVNEPGTEFVCGGRAAIFNNGRTEAENEPLNFESSLIFSDIIPERLEMRRARKKEHDPFVEVSRVRRVQLPAVTLPESPDLNELHLDVNPFIPADKGELELRCREILAIQSTALARRMLCTRAKKMVIGLSGGLDSTWAFLVCVECCKKLSLPLSVICAVTMPGFGTSDRTKGNAEKMAEIFGAELRIIPIGDAVKKHFEDIGHDPEVRDVTYENSQARERTQILMDLANELSGIVIGTGDLSEIALGWCTYNGDQMSMYGVNGSIPKTLMRSLVLFYGAHVADAQGAAVLKDVVDTPVSPELLPGAQHTEELVGSYDLHDFFLWHTVQYGAGKGFLQKAAEKVFEKRFSAEEIASALAIFERRFRTQQFKRNPMPDGAKAGTLSLSPRGDWSAPSDC